MSLRASMDWSSGYKFQPWAQPQRLRRGPERRRWAPAPCADCGGRTTILCCLETANLDCFFGFERATTVDFGKSAPDAAKVALPKQSHSIRVRESGRGELDRLTSPPPTAVFSRGSTPSVPIRRQLLKTPFHRLFCSEPFGPSQPIR